MVADKWGVGLALGGARVQSGVGWGGEKGWRKEASDIYYQIQTRIHTKYIFTYIQTYVHAYMHTYYIYTHI